MSRLVRCRLCPRCGSGSFRKVRADAVLALRKVRECRRCSQQYRAPLPAWACLLIILAGFGMAGWLGLHIAEQRGISARLLEQKPPVILAGVGALFVLFGLMKLIFGRGRKPPERQDWRDRKEPLPPAAPIGSAFVAIAPQGIKLAHTPAPLTSTPRSSIATSHATPRVAVAAASAASAVVSKSALPMPAEAVLAALRKGVVIPAHPLAINSHHEFDERRMRALTRYYLASGVGGLAVGVHTTQFAIRKPKFNLLRPVLETVRHEMQHHENTTGKALVKVAGICGATTQAVAEAQLARDVGYDMGLLNLAALPTDATEFTLIDHCKKVAEILPIFGFYLNPAIGGRLLPFSFWRAFAEIPNVVAIKIAAFNRYQTLDVMRAVAEAGRAIGPGAKTGGNPIAIYTGNDDAIVSDLLGDWTFDVHGEQVPQRIVGGLLGHWACWTRAAVDTFESLRQVNQNGSMPREAAVLARQVTDMNAAIFDAANNFRGAIPGVHEVLRRQGLLEGNWCLDSNEVLSPGQAEEITRVSHAYPHLTDDAFVREHLGEWLK